MGAQKGVMRSWSVTSNKTLWGKEKLDNFLPRQELVDELRKLHEEHREAKRKAQEDSGVGDAGEIDSRGGNY